MLRRSPVVTVLAYALLVADPAPLRAQAGALDGEWSVYGGDAGHTRYAPLDQVDASNATDLEIVWRWNARNFGYNPYIRSATTPLMVNGTLYATAGIRRAVVAIDPGTGETLWTWSMDEGERLRSAPRANPGRGVGYWDNGGGTGRIFVITPGYHLVALDAETGRPEAAFGDGGIVDLMRGHRVRDGIDLVGQGVPVAIAILAAALRCEQQPAFLDVPCRYMEKIAYGPAVKAGPAQVHLDASVRDNLEIIALKLSKRVQDLSVGVLDRKRHEKLIADIRKAGAAVRLISDGDVAACIAPSVPDANIDVYMGAGGAGEAILAAAAIKCLGGELLARMAPADDAEKQQITDALGPKALKWKLQADDLVRGESVVFCATAISDSFNLRGIHIDGNSTSTYSVVMRAKYRTVRYIKAIHDLSRKTIRLRSAGAEAKL